MKILCFADNHFSEKSSILSKIGDKYTLRLHNQIQSINWLEQLAIEQSCDLIVGLGDFFDHATLTDQELTALKDINWSTIPHYFLVGNHESEENDLQYSSTEVLGSKSKSRYIVNEPLLLNYPNNGPDTPEIELAFLPYVVESNKKPMMEYFSKSPNNLRILFMHNDLLGVQLGPVVSRTGFSPEEIASVCHLCVNGHLHNGTQVNETIINLGNLTGKDFSEEASKYSHKIMLIDTDAMKVDFFENPFAFNFYKLEIANEDDLSILASLKKNAIISVKCSESIIMRLREVISITPNILESRIILVKDAKNMENTDLNHISLCVDQCEKFAECCRARLDNTDILEAELAEILK